ncbi:S-adenosyl-L-methionine-dependent methyltransferase [Piptocephalis cylindrospora]|uniref:S-adenosyl-L-methionine-dependent methyltransferase n=1 Tax=Piptocephalis cylindrospora TaxID=1907219 RepID=A0A4P9Y0K7_9FUNG|nr:S-adenosyl-L-methionine-dependent methyltransferase [Piptocephalis cylindrospora]|eukprot:RKP12326.1 S-adenosyl-L-methionine-dependent methyltransferase [Piptocephalis cylindrospora]
MTSPECTYEPQDRTALPEALQRFIENSGVHPDNYSPSSLSIARFVRLAPARPGRPRATLEDLNSQLPPESLAISTELADVFSLPRSTAIATLPLYQEGRIYGVDLASVLAVLVDAECTHDGSISHIAKYLDREDWNVEDTFLHPNRLASITKLQYDLLVNGWRNLRPGGYLVYATCSLTEAQNEGVIDRFLQKHPKDASLCPCLLPPSIIRTPISSAFPGLAECVRLEPRHAHTSGLFFARLKKALVPITTNS